MRLLSLEVCELALPQNQDLIDGFYASGYAGFELSGKCASSKCLIFGWSLGLLEYFRVSAFQIC